MQIKNGLIEIVGETLQAVFPKTTRRENLDTGLYLNTAFDLNTDIEKKKRNIYSTVSNGKEKLRFEVYELDANLSSILDKVKKEVFEYLETEGFTEIGRVNDCYNFRNHNSELDVLFTHRDLRPDIFRVIVGHKSLYQPNGNFDVEIDDGRDEI